ncbi:MAG TPA: leucyl aminopeptidase [Candidatus Acidoferrales bacterium]|jgi:leucyl aminopeptidase|nr:leucyl aminopeptidase [Candidatus Acidoferrales bacterium]
MQIQLESQPCSSIEADALVTYVFDRDDKFDGVLADINVGMNGRLSALSTGGELTGKSLEMVLIHFPQGLAAQRLLLVGAGKPVKFSVNDLRKIAGTALRYLKSRGVKKIAFLAREGERGPEAAQAVVEGLVAADFESDKYRTEKKKREIQSVALAGFDSGLGDSLQAAINHGCVIAESQNFARDLVNEPSNKLTPRILAAKAEAMAKEVGLGIDVLDERRIAELKMGALIGVAQGSVEPPRVIVVRYEPQQRRPEAPVLGLVGKGVTFDTGGISIKPANNMEKMKYDMGGAGTMLGAIRALAFLKPAVSVMAVIPSVENMPGGRAQKPGDVQVAMSGKTIEVINTDAEGRMILADAVTYAKHLGCTHLIDAATLTGAIEVALANVHVGAFGTPREYLDTFLESTKAVGEKMWPMPMDEEYEEMIKSNIADIRNTGSGKGGGASTGAWFIKEFAEDTPWIHLDIASTCWADEGRPWMAKGPTGIAIRSIVDFAMKLK